MEIEREYVHRVYSRLASHCDSNKRLRLWPNVNAFLRNLPPGSVAIDVGCGQMKYQMKDGFLLGSDTCPGVLREVKRNESLDTHLADALHLPYRDDSVDAALFVSVIHHLTSFERRRKALVEIARCLRKRGRVLIYAWAFEQPNGSFPCQDVLVPWHLHENPSNGRLPLVKFHMDSTKEQRIIQGSLPIDVSNEQPSTAAAPSVFSHAIESLLSRFWNSPVGRPPPPIPKYFSSKGGSAAKIVSGIGRWSPALSRRLASLVVSVEEQMAAELSESIVAEAVQEALSTLHKVTFYRYYHVFRKGELEELVGTVGSLRVVSVQYEHANWCLVAEKCDPFTNRPNVAV